MQVTLFEYETLVALKRDHNIELGPEEHRRTTSPLLGCRSPHLVGRQSLGSVKRCWNRCGCRSRRYIEEITGKAIFDPLINRSGLNCKILKGGTVSASGMPCGISNEEECRSRRSKPSSKQSRKAGRTPLSLVDPDHLGICLRRGCGAHIWTCICRAVWSGPTCCATTQSTTSAI